MTNRALKIIEDGEESKEKIANDPMARYGGVISDFCEDYDKRTKHKLHELLEDPTCNTEESETATEYFGMLALEAFEKKVYR